MTAHQNSGNLDSALYYLDLLGKHSEANPSYWKMAANYNQAAGLFYKNTGQPKKALTYMIKNLSLQKTENESKAGLLLVIHSVLLYEDNPLLSESIQTMLRLNKQVKLVGAFTNPVDVASHLKSFSPDFVSSTC